MKNLLIISVFTLIFFSCGGKKESAQSYAPTAKSEQPSLENHPGKSLFQQHCSACHQLDGGGVPNMFPPLKESEYINGEVKWIVSSLVKGLEGPITVKGVEYDNMMPAMDYLSDEDIANILTYVRGSFGNNSGAVTAGEVNKIREELKNE